MRATSPLQQYAGAIRHFASARAVEVLALQASPFLGLVLAGPGAEWTDAVRAVLLLIGSLALTAHVFVFNDWAGRSCDIRDPRRATRVFGRRGVSSRQVARLAIVLLVVSTAALAGIGAPAVLLGSVIAALSVLYSCSPIFGKGTPVAASLIHLLGGSLHFLLGYTVVHRIDFHGVAIAVFFGLVFAGGHLNQEVRDHDGDQRNAIRTNAVVFGCRGTFVASLLVFTAAYGTFVSLAAVGILPRPLIWGALLWPCHLAWSWQTLRNGVGFEAARWMQRRYRMLFAVLGLGILVTASPTAELFRRAPDTARGYRHAMPRQLLPNDSISSLFDKARARGDSNTRPTD